MKVRIGTRGSRLALVQAEAVAAGLRARGAKV
jgi:porphobilinogen deaminase